MWLKVINVDGNSSDDYTYVRNCAGHGRVGDKLWDTPAWGAGSRHTPLDLAVVEFLNALNARVAAFHALLFQFLSIDVPSNIDRYRHDNTDGGWISIDGCDHNGRTDLPCLR